MKRGRRMRKERIGNHNHSHHYHGRKKKCAFVWMLYYVCMNHPWNTNNHKSFGTNDSLWLVHAQSSSSSSLSNNGIRKSLQHMIQQSRSRRSNDSQDTNKDIRSKRRSNNEEATLEFYNDLLYLQKEEIHELASMARNIQQISNDIQWETLEHYYYQETTPTNQASMDDWNNNDPQEERRRDLKGGKVKKSKYKYNSKEQKSSKSIKSNKGTTNTNDSYTNKNSAKSLKNNVDHDDIHYYEKSKKGNKNSKGAKKKKTTTGKSNKSNKSNHHDDYYYYDDYDYGIEDDGLPSYSPSTSPTISSSPSSSPAPPPTLPLLPTTSPTTTTTTPTTVTPTTDTPTTLEPTNDGPTATTTSLPTMGPTTVEPTVDDTPTAAPTKRPSLSPSSMPSLSFGPTVYVPYKYNEGACPNAGGLGVPCAKELNLREKCDKYNVNGSFRDCYESCKPSFCCIHDADPTTNTLTPNCNTDENCAQYAYCYIVWWKLHDTIGPAPYIHPQQDDAFFDMVSADFSEDTIQDDDFYDQLLFHHFDNIQLILNAGIDSTTGQFIKEKIFDDQTYWDTVQ